MLNENNGWNRSMNLVLSTVVLAGFAGTASAQIYVSQGDHAISTYGFDGTPQSTPLISGLTGVSFGMVVYNNNIFATQQGGDIVQYKLDGTLVNSHLITGSDNFLSLAISGGYIYAGSGADVNGVGGGIRQYNLDGTVVNDALVPGLNSPTGLAIAGGHLYVADYDHIGEYNLDGSEVNASLIALPGSYLSSMLFDGTDLYVSDVNNNVVGKYNLDGTAVNAAFITDVQGPWGISINGSDVYVANANGGTVGDYKLSDGSTVNNALFSNQTAGYYGIAPIPQVPEPSTSLLGISAVGVFFRLRRWSTARA